MTMLQPKSSCQLFEATVNLELDYFINLLEEEMTISDFGKRISIKDISSNGIAFYFDNRCIFTITPPAPEESAYIIPAVERFYLNPTLSPSLSVANPALTTTIQ